MKKGRGVKSIFPHFGRQFSLTFFMVTYNISCIKHGSVSPCYLPATNYSSEIPSVVVTKIPCSCWSDSAGGIQIFLGYITKLDKFSSPLVFHNLSSWGAVLPWQVTPHDARQFHVCSLILWQGWSLSLVHTFSWLSVSYSSNYIYTYSTLL